VTALIPARNEEFHIAATLESLRRQTLPPTAVWVIADNCTDATADVAHAYGADVFTTVQNHHRKAGSPSESSVGAKATSSTTTKADRAPSE
jgi:biofilm PGA synthesis N-glycosyltransferase PgaC